MISSTESIERALGEDPRAFIEKGWTLIAYVARYGRGVDVRDWPGSEARRFKRALEGIVEKENALEDSEG